MEHDRQLNEDDSIDDVILLPEYDEDADVLQEFLSGLDDVGDELRGDYGVRKHVRVESRLPMLCSTYIPNLVIADCLLLMTIWLLLFAPLYVAREYLKHDERVRPPSWHFAPANGNERERDLLLNIGFDNDFGGHRPDKPVLFLAGEQMPVDQCFPFLRRESRLFEDLGFNPAEIPVVIRADHRCPHGSIVEMKRIAQEAGFRKFALRVRIRPDDTDD
ncbi:MAG: hypothetical protein HON53_15240 [Planctomycetaceae bacterium]|nr:hypothetical protein [Planctomycetaceae bacterium]MBT6487155.1 hypothetical protein [Planctomycetaceae bacterium]